MDGTFVDSVNVDSLHTVELHGTMLKFKSFDDEYLYLQEKYGEDIKSRGEFCMNFPSQSIQVENKFITVFPMKSVIAVVDILKSIYQKHLAESTSINTKFTKLNLLI